MARKEEFGQQTSAVLTSTYGFYKLLPRQKQLLTVYVTARSYTPRQSNFCIV